MAESSRSKTIGLVGGLGPIATTGYYSALVSGARDRGLPLDLVITHADVARVADLVARADLEQLATYLSGQIDRLRQAGAQVTAIGAVLPHICLPQLRALGCVPDIDPIELLAGTLGRSKFRRVGIFGNSMTMSTNVFGAVDKRLKVDPSPGDEQFVASTYSRLVHSGALSDADQQGLAEVALRLKGAGAEAIVIAGTDFSPVLNTQNLAVDVVDCLAIHVTEMLDRAAEGLL